MPVCLDSVGRGCGGDDDEKQEKRSVSKCADSTPLEPTAFPSRQPHESERKTAFDALLNLTCPNWPGACRVHSFPVLVWARHAGASQGSVSARPAATSNKGSGDSARNAPNPPCSSAAPHGAVAPTHACFDSTSPPPHSMNRAAVGLEASLRHALIHATLFPGAPSASLKYTRTSIPSQALGRTMP